MTDLISRQALLEEYDRLHVGEPGRARKMIEDAPSAQPEKRTEERTETHACDLISRQAAIEALKYNQDVYSHNFHDDPIDKYTTAIIAVDIDSLINLPSAQPDYQEVLGWLLAYHTMSFDLHGRYLPHEVISWLINDFTKEFIAERGQNG